MGQVSAISCSSALLHACLAPLASRIRISNRRVYGKIGLVSVTLQVKFLLDQIRTDLNNNVKTPTEEVHEQDPNGKCECSKMLVLDLGRPVKLKHLEAEIRHKKTGQCQDKYESQKGSRVTLEKLFHINSPFYFKQSKTT